MLRDPDPAFVAEVLTLPAETFLAEQMAIVDPDRLHESRNALRRSLAAELKEELSGLYRALASEKPYSPDARSMGRRALRNLCLGYLGELGRSELAYQQFQHADNMTDAMAALAYSRTSTAPSASRRSRRSTRNGRTSRSSWTSGSRCRRAPAFRAR